MCSIFDADEMDAVLLIDASNAFNALNRAAALHNIRVLCPTLATYMINTYRQPARLFIKGDEELIGTFSTRFFVGNGKPQTAKCHVTTALRSRLQFTFEPQEGLPAVGDLWQGFLPQKIVQPRV